MGQTKFKVLNRSGYSMYWNNSWESKNNYKKNFINYFFLDLFLEKIFDDSLFMQDYFFIKNKQTADKKSYTHKNIVYLQKINEFKSNFKKLKVFNSKIWILNYQQWVVVNVYVYIVKRTTRATYANIINARKKKIINNKEKYQLFVNKFNFL